MLSQEQRRRRGCRQHGRLQAGDLKRRRASVGGRRAGVWEGLPLERRPSYRPRSARPARPACCARCGAQVELKSGEIYRGELHEAEDNWNVQLANVTATARVRRPAAGAAAAAGPAPACIPSAGPGAGWGCGCRAPLPRLRGPGVAARHARCTGRVCAPTLTPARLAPAPHSSLPPGRQGVPHGAHLHPRQPRALHGGE